MIVQIHQKNATSLFFFRFSNVFWVLARSSSSNIFRCWWRHKSLIDWFFCCLELIIIRESRNAKKLEESIFTFIGLHKYRFEFFPKNWNSKFFTLTLGWKVVNSIPALESRWTGKARTFYKIDSSWFWNSSFFIGTDWFYLAGSQFNSSCLCWEVPLKIFGFLPISGILMDQKCHKVLLFQHALIFKPIFLQLYQLHFSIKISIDRFSLDADCLFFDLKLKKFVLCIGMGNMIS